MTRKGKRPETLWKTQQIIDLYRGGLDRDEIIIYLKERYYEMSVPTYYRLLEELGGFSDKDEAEHYQGRVERIKNAFSKKRQAGAS